MTAASNSISKKVVSANLWQIGGKIIGRGFDMITLVILSRILTPADFGLTALAMSVVSITEAITALPLIAVLVRVNEPSESMFDTAFTLSLLRGVVLAVVLVGAAFFMAAFYSEIRLLPLIIALSAAPIVRGAMSPKMAGQMRDLDFRLLSNIEIAAKFAAFLLSLSIAFSTHSYWAIASATICTPIVMTILSFWVAPYRPRFSLANWAYFKDFIGWNSLAQLFTAINWQMDRLLLGHLVPRSSLGKFSIASDLCGIITQAVVVPMSGPLLAAYTRQREENSSNLHGAYLNTSNAVFAVSAPLFVGLGLLAHEAVQIVLGPSWTAASDILRWLSLISVIVLPVWHSSALAMTLGEVRLVTWRSFGEFIVAMPALVIGGLYWGITGIIVARALCSFVILAIGLQAVRQLLGCTIISQVWALRRTAIALLVMAGCILLLRPIIPSTNLLYLAAGTVLVSIVGAFVYCVSLMGLWFLDGKPNGLETIFWKKIAG